MKSYNEILHIACSARCRTLDDLGTDKQQQHSLLSLKGIIPLLEDIGEEDSILDLIKRLSRRHLSEEAHITKCSENKRDKLVYRVCDKQGIVQLIVKVFFVESPGVFEFLYELSAQALLHSLNFKCWDTTEHLGLYKGSGEKEQVLIITETPAKGKSLKILFSDACDEIKQGRDLEGLEKYKEMVAKVARALGELHLKGLGKKGSLSKDTLGSLCYTFIQSQKILKKERPDIDTLGYAKIFQDLMEEAEQEKYAYSYHHGDMNTHNIFYDSDNQLLRIIDYAKVHWSVDISNNGIGTSASDYTQFLEYIYMLCAFGWSDSAIKLLADEYTTNYLAQVQRDLPQALCDLFSFNYRFWAVGRYCNWGSILDPEKRMCAKQLYHYGIKALKQI